MLPSSDRDPGDEDDTNDDVVTAFDPHTLWGTIRRTPTPLRFHSTTFHSIPHRWPVVGERVKVVFTEDGDVLAVHAMTTPCLVRL